MNNLYNLTYFSFATTVPIAIITTTPITAFTKLVDVSGEMLLGIALKNNIAISTANMPVPMAWISIDTL